METSRSYYLQEDDGRSWSSQEWKSGAAHHDRSGKPEENSWDSWQKLTFIVRNLFSTEMRFQQGTESVFTIERVTCVRECPRKGLF